MHPEEYFWAVQDDEEFMYEAGGFGQASVFASRKAARQFVHAVKSQLPNEKPTICKVTVEDLK